MFADQISLVASNLIIPPSSAPVFDGQQYRNILETAGFDSFEWSDVRFPRARIAAQQLARDGLISAMHESWRERSMPQAILAGVEETKIAIAFPLLDKCYAQLDRVQAESGSSLPIIVHPNHQHLGSQPPKRPRKTMPAGMFKEVWFQPTAEWAAARSIPVDSTDTSAVAEQIEAQHTSEGLDGMAIDLHHLMSERNGLRFRDPGKLAVALVARLTFRELQFSLRPDFGADAKELAPAYSGKLEDTKIGGILVEIASSVGLKKPPRIVSEIPFSAIDAAGHADLAQTHAVINNNIRAIFS